MVDAPATIQPQYVAAQPGLSTAPSLRYWRWRLAVPQSELAARAKVNISTVQRLERGGSARLWTINRLADALEVTPAQLMAQPPGTPDGT
jgi:predicted transcriptional regulator